MKLKSSQLSHHLNQQGLIPVYLLIGNEPLQMTECLDILRIFARSQGFTERTSSTVDTGFDWQQLSQQADNLSLFASKQLLEVHLGSKSPGEAGAKALIAYAQRPPPDKILVVTIDKLDASQQKSKWFTQLEERAGIVTIKPIEIAQLPDWIAQRLTKQGLQASSEAIHLIAERSEGHLLSCAQEIEKLGLLYGQGMISVEQVLEAVADSARFELFSWVDTVLSGETQRVVHQLQRLRAEGCEPILLAWALARELRNLCQIAQAIHSGQTSEQISKNYRLWPQKKNLILQAVKRYPPSGWYQLLRDTVKIDRIIKGIDKGNPWDALQQLSLQIAGLDLWGHLSHTKN